MGEWPREAPEDDPMPLLSTGKDLLSYGAMSSGMTARGAGWTYLMTNHREWSLEHCGSVGTPGEPGVTAGVSVVPRGRGEQKKDAVTSYVSRHLDSIRGRSADTRIVNTQTRDGSGDLYPPLYIAIHGPKSLNPKRDEQKLRRDTGT